MATRNRFLPDQEADERYEQLEYSFDRLETQTEMAWLLVMDGEALWFPKSRCEIDEEAKTILVPRWLAEEKGLE